MLLFFLFPRNSGNDKFLVRPTAEMTVSLIDQACSKVNLFQKSPAAQSIVWSTEERTDFRWFQSFGLGLSAVRAYF